MFRRRENKGAGHRLRELVWPRAGWSRAGKYLWLRLHRLPGGDWGVAAGFACGAAASMTPTMGLHFVLAALMAWAMRANILASAIGTVIGNPWTFPLIWWGTFRIGVAMVGADHLAPPQGAVGAPGDGSGFHGLFATLWKDLQAFDLPHLLENVWPLWWPMAIGSLPLALAAWVLCYGLVRWGMERYRRLRSRRPRRRGLAPPVQEPGDSP